MRPLGTFAIAALIAVLVGTGALAARKPAAGALDPSFGKEGRVEISVGGRVVAGELLVLPGRALLVAGHTVERTGLDGGRIVLVKRLANGRRDRSFGVGGRVITALPGGPVVVSALARQRDGRLLIAGTIGAYGSDQDVLVARLTPDGTLDGSFGSGGVRRIDLGQAAEGATALAVQPDGRIVIAGSVTLPVILGPPGEAFVLRLGPDGRTDDGFARGGVVRLRSSGSMASMGAMGVTVQADGRVVVAGNLSDSSSQREQMFVGRYAADGQPDTAVGPEGYRALQIFNHRMRAMAEDPRTGRLVLAGESGWASPTRFLAARLTEDLELDRGFSGDGYATLSFARSPIDVALAAAIDRSGRVLLAGTALRRGFRSGSFALARLTSSGRRDRRFGRGGLTATRFGSGWNVARALALQGSRIVSVGSDGGESLEGGGRTIDIARYR